MCVCMCACVLVDGWADDEYACPHACMHMHMQTRARHINQEPAGKASFATAAAAAATALQLTACRGEQPPPQVEQGRSVRMAQPTHTGHVRWLHRKISAAGFHYSCSEMRGMRRFVLQSGMLVARHCAMGKSESTDSDTHPCCTCLRLQQPQSHRFLMHQASAHTGQQPGWIRPSFTSTSP